MSKRTGHSKFPVFIVAADTNNEGKPTQLTLKISSMPLQRVKEDHKFTQKKAQNTW